MAVQFDPSFFGKVLRSEPMQAAMVHAAESGAEHARSISPVKSGEYRDSFEVERASFDTRDGATLTNTAGHAASVEWKQGRHVLGQTLAKMEADSRG